MQPSTKPVAATFAHRLLERRRALGLSQDEVGARAGILGKVLGRYERAEAKPSIEVAAGLARALGVSLDYLAGVTDAELDAPTTDRVLAVQALDSEDRGHVYAMLDAFITRRKLEAIM